MNDTLKIDFEIKHSKKYKRETIRPMLFINDELITKGDKFDVSKFIESAYFGTDEYYIVNCDCLVPECSNIEEGIYVYDKEYDFIWFVRNPIADDFPDYDNDEFDEDEELGPQPFNQYQFTKKDYFIEIKKLMTDLIQIDFSDEDTFIEMPDTVYNRLFPTAMHQLVEKLGENWVFRLKDWRDVYPIQHYKNEFEISEKMPRDGKNWKIDGAWIEDNSDLTYEEPSPYLKFQTDHCFHYYKIGRDVTKKEAKHILKMKDINSGKLYLVPQNR